MTTLNQDIKIFFNKYGNKIMNEEHMPDEIKTFMLEEVNFLDLIISPYALRILEVGSGTGRIYDYVKHKAPNITCLDFSARMIEEIEKKILAKDVTVFYNICDPTGFRRPEHIDPEHSKFSYILCMGNTFGNIPGTLGPETALENMINLVEDDGLIIISVLSEESKEIQKEMYKRMGLKGIREVDNNSIVTAEGLYSRRYSEQELAVLATRFTSEFKVIKTSPYNNTLLLKSYESTKQQHL